MGIFDLVLVVIIIGFLLYGFRAGLIQTIGAIVGVVVATVLTGRIYERFIPIGTGIFWGNATAGKIGTFVIIFILITHAVGILFWFFEKIFNMAAVLPFMKLANRLAGAVLGLVEGVLVVGICLNVAGRFVNSAAFASSVNNSKIALSLVKVGEIFMPLLPEAIKKIQSLNIL